MHLYPHNASAYASAVTMLSEKGKAAVIHPTGTGKSFIGFKLCEDNPDKKILWLSPSEYIFKTQLENLRKAANGYDPKNIVFLTYAKLMLLDEDEISGIRPDYIILDEFHRSGASEWGKGVLRLLDIYKEVPLLGLTATNIRYLDGQRDMAEELFDGNIASHMTLGEAIVRGILNPPRYVLSVYSYKRDIEAYRRKIEKAKNRAAKQKAEEIFEVLRRKLTNAEGLEEVFSRHMTEKNGKYLVFCSSAEHMEEMIDKVPEWFSKVDKAPHIYRAYAEDSSTVKEFKAFKEDESDHLKLLFCIDMLNEGVHVENLSGVILLRPTVSPIVFKQQIGRALSAGSAENAVIFDIVLNIENMYSIDAVKQEMQAAITYYRYLGEYEKVVNDRFAITDETGDCRKLFAKLEQSLNSAWDLMYEEARKYYCEHGDLRVPAKYRTTSGASLGNWLNVQRRIYNGKAAGFLTDAQITKLNNLGIVWDSYRDLSWEKNYLEARDYYEKYGDLLVPLKYVTESGVPLGAWIVRMRQARANGRLGEITEERIAKLDEIGMCWDALSDQWERNYAEALDYYRKHGNLLVPAHYVSPHGIKLGNWIAYLRRTRSGNGRGRLTDEQIKRLDKIGMSWDADETRALLGLEAALVYSREYGNLIVPPDYVSKDGFRLGAWIKLKRSQYKKGTLSPEMTASLEKLGMQWEVRAERWQEMYDAAKEYYKANGDLTVPRTYRTRNGYNLNLWIGRMRRGKKTLSVSQIKALKEIGIG